MGIMIECIKIDETNKYISIYINIIINNLLKFNYRTLNKKSILLQRYKF